MKSESTEGGNCCFKMDARSKILKERDYPQLLNRVAPNLSITRPREKAKAKKSSTGAPHSTVKYKSYGDPTPNVLKVFLYVSFLLINLVYDVVAHVIEFCM